MMFLFIRRGGRMMNAVRSWEFGVWSEIQEGKKCGIRNVECGVKNVAGCSLLGLAKGPGRVRMRNLERNNFEGRHGACPTFGIFS